MDWEDAVTEDRIWEGNVAGRPCYIHRDHRWALAIALRELGEALPLTLVTFDAHTDLLEPSSTCKGDLEQALREGPTVERVADICQRKLSRNDDDWILAGMELGMVRHAVALGVSHWAQGLRDLTEYLDHRGVRHGIAVVGHPGEEFEYQGKLSDVVRSGELAHLWSLLGWSWEGTVFGFEDLAEPIWLDVDLDAFAVKWEEFLFPWPEEVWSKRYHVPSGYFSTKGWTGRKFFQQLVKRARLITISTEPDCCGGDAKALRILKDLSRHLLSQEDEVPIDLSMEYDGR